MTCEAPAVNNLMGLGGPRCGKPATHRSIHGFRCDVCAEKLRAALRDPHTLGNILAGDRPRTEAEIDRMIQRIEDPS